MAEESADLAPSKQERKPYKLTPEVQALVCEYIAKGCFLETAALSAGVTRETLRLWQKRGADQRKRRVYGKHRRFLEAVEQAMAEHEGCLVARIVDAGKEQWQADAWLLERRFPGRYEQHRTSERVRRDSARLEQDAARAALDRDRAAASAGTTARTPEELDALQTELFGDAGAGR